MNKDKLIEEYEFKIEALLKKIEFLEVQLEVARQIFKDI
tara:strand:+ start:2189 stop:2305 length:117 start_codon:yes stop_codon:yes gene_type:complete